MLTPKQERYVEELVKGKTQRQAYKAAYNASRMKDSTIDNKASWLLTKDEIRARYNELMEEAKNRGGNDAARMRAFIIEQLTKIATGEGQDTSEIYNAEGDLLQSRKGSRQIDRITALNKLAELYGITGSEEQEQIKIVLEKSEGYNS
jgi:hypothetical protein